MASKQLGKLRQWAGEKIASEKKTIATEEFKEVEIEVERRRIGLDVIYENSRSYYNYLTKKREVNDPDQKLSAMEAMGRVMVSHGEEFGPDSAYGHGLSALGNAHIKVAAQQDEFADAFNSLYLTRLESSIEEIALFYALRKKLKSRRLAYDAAVSQSQKQFKREKEKADAEEEVAKARARFEEMSEEVRAQVERIQDGEMDQFRDLGRLLNLEYKFVEGWLNQLKEIKADWPNDSDVYRIAAPQSQGPTHILQPASSSKSAREEETVSDSSGPPQRPAQHQRTTSVATTNSQGRKSSMSTWASAAVGSLLRKEKSSNFEELNDDDKKQEDTAHGKNDQSAPTLKRTKSGRVVPPPPRSRAQSTMSEALSSKHNSPRLPLRSLPPEKPTALKTRRALYAFSGANDELNLEVGDEITVISEPSETWWMGECKGKRGLFPVNYTEDAPKRPPLPARPSNLSKPGPPDPPAPRSRPNSISVARNLSPDWTDEPFGDHHSAQTPAHSPDYRQTTFNRDESDDEGERLLSNRETSDQQTREDAGTRNASKSSPGTAVRQLRRSLSGKKAAPPPPPSRRSNSASVARLPSSDSPGGSPFLLPTNPTSQWEPSTSNAAHGREYSDSKSPFEEGDSTSFNNFSLTTKCRTCSCEDFQQNRFKKDGYCNTCFHSHI